MVTTPEVGDGPAIDVDRLVQLTSEMATFPSQIPNEGPLAEYLAQWMIRSGGFDEVRTQPVVPGRSNVVGIVRGSGPGRRLLLNGHMDVPHPVGEWSRDPHDGAVVDGRVYGVGLTDMKGAVACMLDAAERLSRHRGEFRGEVVVSAVIHHNVCGLGTKFFLANSDLEFDGAINGEPTDLAVQLEHGGAWQFQISTFGRAKHTSREGINAVGSMTKVLAALSTDILSPGERDIEGLPRLVVGSINGGSSASRTAEVCTVQGDVRTVPGMTEETLRRDISNVLERLSHEDSEFSARVDGLSYQRPFIGSDEWEIVQVVASEHRRLTGNEATFSRGLPMSAYVTDSSDLARAGIPTAIYGPGDWNGEPDESISIEDLVTASQVYAGSALSFLS